MTAMSSCCQQSGGAPQYGGPASCCMKARGERGENQPGAGLRRGRGPSVDHGGEQRGPRRPSPLSLRRKLGLFSEGRPIADRSSGPSPGSSTHSNAPTTAAPPRSFWVTVLTPRWTHLVSHSQLRPEVRKRRILYAVCCLRRRKVGPGKRERISVGQCDRSSATVAASTGGHLDTPIVPHTQLRLVLVRPTNSYSENHTIYQQMSHQTSSVADVERASKSKLRKRRWFSKNAGGFSFSLALRKNAFRAGHCEPVRTLELARALVSRVRILATTASDSTPNKHPLVTANPWMASALMGYPPPASKPLSTFAVVSRLVEDIACEKMRSRDTEESDWRRKLAQYHEPLVLGAAGTLPAELSCRVVLGAEQIACRVVLGAEHVPVPVPREAASARSSTRAEHVHPGPHVPVPREATSAPPRHAPPCPGRSWPMSKNMLLRG